MTHFKEFYSKKMKKNFIRFKEFISINNRKKIQIYYDDKQQYQRKKKYKKQNAKNSTKSNYNFHSNSVISVNHQDEKKKI